MLNYKKIKGLIKLLRPELPFAAGICVIIGEILALGQFPTFREMILGFIWGFFLSGAAMILNDYFDIEVDKVNAPERPLPSGLVSKNEVIIFTGIITFLGLVASFYINRLAVILYIIFWIIGFLYNWKFKEKGLFGNLFVSSSVAVTILLGGIVVSTSLNTAVIIFSLMVFLFNLGEEIGADAMDIEGDKMRDTKSVAILIGRKNALNISFLLFLVFIGLSSLPYFFGTLGLNYLIIISLTDLVVLILAVKLFKNPSIKLGRKYIRQLYLSALTGLLLIIISMIVF